MSAWVSRRRVVDGKRKFERLPAGDKGVKQHDEFVVFVHFCGKTTQERIKVLGKPGKRLADQIAADRNAQIHLGQFGKDSKRRWDEYRKHFEKVSLSSKSTNTKKSYGETYDLFEELMKPTLMENISKITVDTFRSKLQVLPGKKRSSNMAPATVNRHLRQLKVLLRSAFDDKALPELPKFVFLREPEKLPVYMLPEHFEQIYNACDSAVQPSGRAYLPAQWWRALMTVAILTGMRISELQQLRRSEFDIEHGLIRVSHSKTKGKRDELIPVHEVAVQHVADLKGFEPLIFDWPQGRSRLYDEWHKIQQAAGISLKCHERHEHTDACKYYGFHSLKMACGTMNANRLPQLALNAFMRHRSVSTTAKYYRHTERVAADSLPSVYVPDVTRKPG